MLTRRDFLGKALQGAVATSALGATQLIAAEKLAWTKPIGLELYTVRHLFEKDPAGTLKQVAAAGYQEVEIGPGVKPETLKPALQAAGLSLPSGYFDEPKSIDDWKKSVELAHQYGQRYIVVGDNPSMDAEAWKRRADFYNECGKASQAAGIQFCYHAHFHEFADTGGTCGYDIMLKQCDPKLLKMEMDIFWVTYAGKDPLPYWKKYPGRFPLLHIKDMRKDITINPQEDPGKPNPFVPVGQGRIDWPKIFAHVHEAGAQHIFVEQDECDMPPLDAIKISYEYLKSLRVS
ncbi:MAG TPA: sugar phosphate isomerase/epimerase [Terriglobia bacterium]|nr:sugar phosphate isomerase/epimerase [Terriglobia bacterium]